MKKDVAHGGTRARPEIVADPIGVSVYENLSLERASLRPIQECAMHIEEHELPSVEAVPRKRSR